MTKYQATHHFSRMLLSAFAFHTTIGAATAQTKVWSEPTKTEVWSETTNGPTAEQKSKPKPQATQTSPAKTSPKQSETGTAQSKNPPKKPQSAPSGGKVDSRLVGTWDVRIPTSVTYHTRDQRTYQRITPGANFHRLIIQANGSYRWGTAKGTLKEVRPYFIAEGQRYFEIVKDKQNKYLIRYNERDKSLAVFFDVGGFVAKGTRVTTKAPARPAPKKSRSR